MSYAFQFDFLWHVILDIIEEMLKIKEEMKRIADAHGRDSSFVSNTYSRAEITAENKRNGFLQYSQELENLLQGLKARWWPQADLRFPNQNAKEIKHCQPFVTSVWKLFASGQVAIKDDTKNVQIRSCPFAEAYRTPTVGKKRPDCVFYDGLNKTGVSAITMVGEVTGGGHDDFADEDIGQLIDVTVCVMKSQPFRRFMLSFLTDGRRIQFFRCVRNHAQYKFEYSSAFEKKPAWQVID